MSVHPMCQFCVSVCLMYYEAACQLAPVCQKTVSQEAVCQPGLCVSLAPVSRGCVSVIPCVSEEIPSVRRQYVSMTNV